jgi:D-alanine transaminase/branched-chain amino acid aminotransferase
MNDRFVPEDQAALPVNDLGVQRGYGIFDFLRVSNGIPLFIDDHLDRFYHSAREMRLPVRQTKEELKGILSALLQKNNLPDAGVRILLTGGNSPDGYQVAAPSLVIIQQPLLPPSSNLSQPCKLVTYQHQRQMPHIKTTDYLMAVWLQPWIKQMGADDVLYQQNGMVSECPRSNFFIVTGNHTIQTPASNILKGITRKQVLKVAAGQGILVEEKDISLEDIRMASEAFIASSTKRIIPVGQVDDIVFEAVSANPVTTRLFELLLQNEREAISTGV